MKKILFLAAIIGMTACNDEETTQQEDCEVHLWSLTKNCDVININDCIYVATFGETEAELGSTVVDESTYDHYMALGNPNDGSLCWEGTQ